MPFSSLDYGGLIGFPANTRMGFTGPRVLILEQQGVKNSSPSIKSMCNKQDAFSFGARRAGSEKREKGP